MGDYCIKDGYEHRTIPTSKMGLWRRLIKDPLRLLRKFVSINYWQVAECRPAKRS